MHGSYMSFIKQGNFVYATVSKRQVERKSGFREWQTNEIFLKPDKQATDLTTWNFGKDYLWFERLDDCLCLIEGNWQIGFVRLGKGRISRIADKLHLTGGPVSVKRLNT